MINGMIKTGGREPRTSRGRTPQARGEHKISNLVLHPQGDDRSIGVSRNAPEPLRCTYRSTAEALKHERYLYLAKAGPYVGEDRHRPLAERIEGWPPTSTPSGPPATTRPVLVRRIARQPAPQSHLA